MMHAAAVVAVLAVLAVAAAVAVVVVGGWKKRPTVDRGLIENRACCRA